MVKNSKGGKRKPRNTMWVLDPTDDICIIGGKGLPAEERGSLDTDDGAEHELFDPRIFKKRLTEEFINNIDAHGVDTPIVIAKDNGVTIVVVGKRRVRAARVVNRRRKKRGEPPIKIDCKLKRDTVRGLFASMIVENENREDDDFLAKLENLKRMMNRGVSVEDAAVSFGRKVQTLKGWLAFDDNAISETKKAAKDGQLSPSAAATLATIKDPKVQLKKLQQLLSTKDKVSKAAATAAAQNAAGKTIRVSDKKTQKRFLSYVQNISSPDEEEQRFWQAVEATCKLFLGAEDVDPRLTGKLNEVISLMRVEASAKKKQQQQKQQADERAEAEAEAEADESVEKKPAASKKSPTAEAILAKRRQRVTEATVEA